jgi:ABC-type thiamin/hydroxymethylpyrimidine transport system permease subunit
MISVFGALWGAIEISLGSVLKSLYLPFSGAVLAMMGLAVVLIGRLFVPRPGATLFVGVIATLLKLLSFGGVVVGPMLGILSEALLAELALSLFGKPSRGVFLLAGALGLCWTLVQPFVTGVLLFGRDTLEV